MERGELKEILAEVVKQVIDEKIEDLRRAVPDVDELKNAVQGAVREAFAGIKPMPMAGEDMGPGLPEDFMTTVCALLRCVPWPPCYSSVNFLGPEIFRGMEIEGKLVSEMLKELSGKLAEPEDQLVVKVFREVLAPMLATGIYELWREP